MYTLTTISSAGCCRHAKDIVRFSRARMIRWASPTVQYSTVLYILHTCVDTDPCGLSPVMSLSTFSVADHRTRRHSLFDKSATDGFRLFLSMAMALLETGMVSARYGLVWGSRLRRIVEVNYLA